MDYTIVRYDTGDKYITQKEYDALPKEEQEKCEYWEFYLDVELEGEWEDCGYGETEFWGIKDYDEDWEFTVTGIASACDDDDGYDWKDDLTQDEIDDIIEQGNEYASEHPDKFRNDPY